MLLACLSNQLVSRQLEGQEVSPLYKNPIQVLLSYFLQEKERKKEIHLTTTYEIESQNEVLSKKPCLFFLYGRSPSTLHLKVHHTQSAQRPWYPLLGSAGCVSLSETGKGVQVTAL